MEEFYLDEGKAQIDGFEIPVECIRRRALQNPGIFCGKHYHEYVELLFGLDCDALVWMDGEVAELKTGNFIVINSKTVHTVISKCAESNYIVVKFMPQILYAAEQSVFEFKYLLPFLRRDSTCRKMFEKGEMESTPIPSLMKNLLSKWEGRAYGYEIALRTCVTQIALWLLRIWYKESNGEDIGLSESRETLCCVQKSIEYVQSEFSSATTVEAARRCGLSYSYFSRLFKRVMHKSFTAYVASVKINEAKRLLATTDKSITEVAMECGFSTTSYFAKQFKKATGVTPMKFGKDTSA